MKTLRTESEKGIIIDLLCPVNITINIYTPLPQKDCMEEGWIPGNLRNFSIKTAIAPSVYHANGKSEKYQKIKVI
jgi:hypothetical protein